MFSGHQSFTVTNFGEKNVQVSISSSPAERVFEFGLAALALISLFMQAAEEPQGKSGTRESEE